LCGESFGACIALQIALQFFVAEAPLRSSPKLGTIHRLILINPATAFRNLPLLVLGSFLPEFVPSFFYRFSTLGFAGLLLAAEHVAVGDRQSLLAAMQKLSPQTVAWRLQLLRDLDVARLPLEQLDIPVLLMAGERDRLLPSVEEIQRLAQRLPQVQTRFLPKSGHACLLEQAVNLGEILRSSPGFF
ncbi:MAG: alpha/beta hydrolase, partial [Synechococcales cyanobacterium CRU_2_2]|nr:alpha/beta hydrolase [Synechococcales cyanobacterium CRU_2_2]